jgi:primosomal protein N' (replication factor Y)
MSGLFVDVILPLSLPRTYTYSVPLELADAVQSGKRVIVQLGKQKMYAGLVHKVHQAPPLSYEVKPIVSVLDNEPVVNARQLELWEWIASYYMSNLGDVMNVALPSALKLQSETRIVLNESYDHSHEHLTDDEYLVYEGLLGRPHLTPEEAAKILHRKSAHQVLKTMIEKGAILVEEEIREKYRPKKEIVLSLAPVLAEDEDALKAVFESLEKRSPKQLEALMAFLKIHYDLKKEEWIARSEVIKSGSVTGAVNALVKKGIFLEKSVVKDRLAHYDGKTVPPAALSPSQHQALEDIRNEFEKHEVVLLHGVTSSGKTEVYVHLIQEMLDKEKQVLFLLPEIALTAQMINRLKKVLGDRIDVYHSRFSLNERAEVWKRVLQNDPRSQVILGARSAMFLPFSNLGLILIDEEHDASFKQSDPAPRYHARDSALVLARIHSAKTLMGTATPCMESYSNALHGKFGLVRLPERFGGLLLPEIKLVDTREAARKKQMKSHFSPDLLEAIQQALDNKEQVILFQNRRGFAPIIECTQCAWTPHCKNCSVTLTYHKQFNLLKCHYCGYSSHLPSLCDACGSHRLELRGLGTEKIEEEMAIFFPKAVTARLDLDAARSRQAYVSILADFEDRKIDILVGTQMITKGLDFDNVNLVGIINADQLLNFPDFRAFERSFQLLQQVSGRSGRKFKRGNVIIQTHQPHALGAAGYRGQQLYRLVPARAGRT